MLRFSCDAGIKNRKGVIVLQTQLQDSEKNETYCVLHASLGYTQKQAREALRDIVSIFEVAPVTHEIVVSAINSDETDYEDAVVRAVAETNACDAIISYDKKAFKKCTIPRLEP